MGVVAMGPVRDPTGPRTKTVTLALVIGAVQRVNARGGFGVTGQLPMADFQATMVSVHLARGQASEAVALIPIGAAARYTNRRGGPQRSAAVVSSRVRRDRG